MWRAVCVVVALCLAAGLEGVEQQLEVPPPNTANLFSETDGMSAKQMAANCRRPGAPFCTGCGQPVGGGVHKPEQPGVVYAEAVPRLD